MKYTVDVTLTIELPDNVIPTVADVRDYMTIEFLRLALLERSPPALRWCRSRLTDIQPVVPSPHGAHFATPQQLEWRQ